MNIPALQWSVKLGGDLLGWSVVALFVVGFYFCFKVARQGTLTVLVPVLYVLVAIGFSYLMRLKELRHLMAVVPMAALVIGVGIGQSGDRLTIAAGAYSAASGRWLGHCGSTGYIAVASGHTGQRPCRADQSIVCLSSLRKRSLLWSAALGWQLSRGTHATGRSLDRCP